MSLIIAEILLILINILHLILFVIFAWWAYLLYKDTKRGNNGITRSLRRLVLFKDVSSELWSLIMVTVIFYGLYTGLQVAVMGLRLVQLLAVIYAVTAFIRVYKKELDVNNNSSKK